MFIRRLFGLQSDSLLFILRHSWAHRCVYFTGLSRYRYIPYFHLPLVCSLLYQQVIAQTICSSPT